MNDDFAPVRPYSEVQKDLTEKMLREVSRNDHAAVSFKMWDTLVLMPFSQPEDLFLFMEDDFAMYNTGKKTFTELRTEAQRAAEKKYALKGNVTLEKIYDIFVKLSGISPACREKLIIRECDLVHHFAFPRKTGKLLFDKAKYCRNKVIVVSDSYYPRDVVVKILCDCGYGEYSSLVIPSESSIPDSAATGFIDLVIKKSGVGAENILHIGSDLINDVEATIQRGMKALLLQPVLPLMVKSGRLRGFIEEKHLYDIDEKQFMALRCAFALYAAYGFDAPQNKLPKSDFCCDEYMIGFIILGPLCFIKDFEPQSDMQSELIAAMEKNKKIMDGRLDFEKMLYHHFGDFIGKYGSEGCQLALEFLEKHSYIGDREKIIPFLSDKGSKKWGRPESEPKLAPVHTKPVKKNALQKLADKLFPEGTKVRNMTDDVLAGKKRKK
ncbi:MAG: hypothetical protein J6U00_14405 [Ruminococcus sp.]|uniref:hypothetical protein n=1 Tax=Ruminococcus sp. TaxID=41978 RepID=UPI001B144A67|nr:hypothetical protein [Ruminococcus sp.]MBO7475164.1 hypothetical protein [Ruminococcus sp.]